MLSNSKISEVQYLLLTFPEREVAKLAGVSRSSVNNIAIGRLKPHTPHPRSLGEVPPHRCPTCGARIITAECRLCERTKGWRSPLVAAIVLWVLLLAGSVRAWDGIQPDPKVSPGAILPNVTVEQLMTSGYANGRAHDGVKTKGARNVSEALKKQIFLRDLGKVPEHPGNYEIDHICPIKLGGANVAANLFAQSYPAAHDKDRLEDRMAALVNRELKAHGHAAATKLLRKYQHDICDNWPDAYREVFGRGTLSIDLKQRMVDVK